jgi:hypothetical protein
VPNPLSNLSFPADRHHICYSVEKSVVVRNVNKFVRFFRFRSVRKCITGMTGSVDWKSDNVIPIVKTANKLSLVRYLLFWNMFLFPFAVISSPVNMSVFLSCLLKEVKVLNFLLFRHGIWFWGRSVSCKAQHSSLSVWNIERITRVLSSDAQVFFMANMFFVECWYCVNSDYKILKYIRVDGLINIIQGIKKILVLL